MAQQQRLVTFAGTVQGVGFRYTACRLAGQFDITGDVRNCPDGTVECVVEGDAAEIDAFLEALRRQMASCIRRITQQTAPYSGQYVGFTVRY